MNTMMSCLCNANVIDDVMLHGGNEMQTTVTSYLHGSHHMQTPMMSCPHGSHHM